jgi:hypothetical protein
MRYALLIYYPDDTARAEVDPELAGRLLAAHREFQAAATAAGVLLGGEALEAPDTVTTVRSREGRVTTTDGPFVETKEVLAGFYLVECADLDAAIEWAARIPSGLGETIEVRPIRVFD